MPGDTSIPSKIPSSVPDLLALKNQATAALKRQREAYQEYSDLKKLSEVLPGSVSEDELVAKRQTYNEASGEYTAALSRLERQERLAKKAKNLQRKQDALDLAGLTQEERDNAKVVWQDDDITQIYYGGTDKEDGEGHGHIVITNGKITYWRSPFSSHGGHNFVS